MWFESLFGIKEKVVHSNLSLHSHIHSNFEIIIKNNENFLLSKTNRKMFPIGKFSTPSLKILREDGINYLKNTVIENPGIKVFHEIVNDLIELHSSNSGSTFQAASQFNCLEFPHPNIIPEDGITNYEFDNTQGPACAIACGAGTLYRNYFVPVNGSIGQTEHNQINNLDRLEDYFGNEKYWNIKNGYTFSDELSLESFQNRINNEDPEKLTQYIKVGLHENVGVTMLKRNVIHPSVLDGSASPLVTQVYCSAVSCAYSGVSNKYWEPLAKIVLDANYEATLWASLLHSPNTDSINRRSKVYLTFLGGGVFGNDNSWINQAIAKSIYQLNKYGANLDVVICHYRSLNFDRIEEIDGLLELYKVCLS